MVRARLVKPRLPFRRLFSTRPNLVQTREGVSALPLRSRHAHWIVGRGLCMYRCEDFGGVPRNRRRSALELKLPVWSPFERTGYHCVWSGAAAMVWFWDEDKVSAARAAHAGPGAKAPLRVLPETVFHPRKPDGLHLQPCREGFELQHWRADRLRDAFWFPERPRERQVGWFLGRQEGEARAAAPASVRAAPDAAFAAEPWSTSLAPREWLEANERAVVTLCLLALALAVLWQEARFWKVRHLERAVTAELARMQDRLGPLLEARNALLGLRRTNRALSGLLNEPSQAHLMSVVDRALPSAEAEFREWRYQQRELELVIEDPHPDPIAYVRALEAEPLFEQVRAEPARGGDDRRLEITLRVRG